MKKQYRLLLYIIVFELVLVFILGANGFKVKSWLGNAIGVFIFLLPVQILLLQLDKEETISKRKRIWFKIIFWHINICYILGAIATLIG